MTVKSATVGNFIYYVNDSTAPKTTCIADTFTVQVTSTMASAVIRYDVLPKDKKALIQWTTEQETNSDYFTIERSSNGSDFETVMVIDAKGSSSTATQYEFIDNSVLPGSSYYRLIATDNNAARQIVGVKMISNNTSAATTVANSANGMK